MPGVLGGDGGSEEGGGPLWGVSEWGARGVLCEVEEEWVGEEGRGGYVRHVQGAVEGWEGASW